MTLQPNATEILPNLWIGNSRGCPIAREKEFKTICVLENPCSMSEDCTHKQILNREAIMGKDQITKEEYRSLVHVEPDLMNQVIKTLDEYLSSGPLLVHCAAGIERSPLVCAMYIHRKFGISFNKSYDWVKVLRPATQDRKFWL